MIFQGPTRAISVRDRSSNAIGACPKSRRLKRASIQGHPETPPLNVPEKLSSRVHYSTPGASGGQQGGWDLESSYAKNAVDIAPCYFVQPTAAQNRAVAAAAKRYGKFAEVPTRLLHS